MRLASAGEAPAVEIAIASGPVRTIAGQDEVAQRRDVDDVDEHRAALRVVVDADVDVGVVRRGDRDEGGLEVGGLVLAPEPLDRAFVRASRASSGSASGAISTTRPSQASRPSTFSSPIAPPPTTTQRLPVNFRQAM